MTKRNVESKQQIDKASHQDDLDSSEQVFDSLKHMTTISGTTIGILLTIVKIEEPSAGEGSVKSILL